MKTASARPILIVDDDPTAVALTASVLAKANITAPIEVVHDGALAIDYLMRKLTEGDEALPLMLFLDLKMPGTDGFHVLGWISNEPRLRRLLTVVLSSSTYSKDVDQAYALGARGYLGKYPLPAEIRTVFQLAQSMMSIDQVEELILPGMRPTPADAQTDAGAPG